MLLAVVGDTDGAGLGLGQLGHGLPGVDDGDAVLDVDVAALDGAVGFQGEVVVAALEGDGPVDEVELDGLDKTLQGEMRHTSR